MVTDLFGREENEKLYYSFIKISIKGREIEYTQINQRWTDLLDFWVINHLSKKLSLKEPIDKG